MPKKKIDKRHSNPGRPPGNPKDKRVKLALWGKAKHAARIAEEFQPKIDKFSDGLDKKEK